MNNLFTKQKAYFSLLVMIIWISVAIWQVTGLNFVYDFDHFFPDDDPASTYYKTYKTQYGNDNDFLLIALSNDEQTIFRKEFLSQLEQLVSDLQQDTILEAVHSLLSSKNIVFSGKRVMKFPVLHVNEPVQYKADSTLIFKQQKLVKQFISEDATSTIVFVKHPSGLSKRQEQALCQKIETKVDQYTFPKVYIAGRIKAESTYINRMKVEMRQLVLIAIILIVAFMYLSFRSVRAVLLTIVVIGSSCVSCFAVIALSGADIDVLTVMIPTILFVISVSDVVHFLNRYQEEVAQHTHQEAIRKMIFGTGKSTLLTSITTAIGFLALTFSNIIPIQRFGFFTAIGVMITYLVTLIIMTALKMIDHRSFLKTKEKKSAKWLMDVYDIIQRRSKLVMVTTLLVLVVAMFGIARININARLLDEVKVGDPFQEELLFFEKNYAGSRPFELEVKATTGNIVEYQNLKQAEAIQKKAQEIFNVGRPLSIVEVVKEVNQAAHQGSMAYYRVPVDEANYLKLMPRIKKAIKRFSTTQLITEDSTACRISSTMPDIGSAAMKEKVNTFNRLVTNGVTYEITGSIWLIDRAQFVLSSNLIQGVGLAFLAIALLMGVMYRSIKMVCIALVPNVIPIILIGGFIGFVGIDLKLTTAIIFTIALGIAVDDTIHYMSRLKQELKEGESLSQACKNTFFSTGKAILITSFIICGGFISFLGSSFTSTYYVGLLVSITLVVAVLADLVLLPVLLMVFNKREK